MRPLCSLLLLGLVSLNFASCDDGKSRKDRDDDDDGKSRRDRDDDEGKSSTGDEERESSKRGRKHSIEGEKCSEGLSITEVVISGNETTISFEIDPETGPYLIYGPGGEYAFQVTDAAARSGGIYKLTDVVGVQIWPNELDTTKGDLSFDLVFEPLPPTVDKIYLTEGPTWAGVEGLWRCDDVELK